MRVSDFVFVAVLACCRVRAAITGDDDDDDGSYKPDGSGAYVHDHSGDYIPDFSGLYRHDNSGRYRGDESGRYRDNLDKYRGDGTGSRFGNIGQGSAINQKLLRPSTAFNLNGLDDDSKTKNLFVASTNVVTTARPAPVNLKSYDKEGHWKIIRQAGDADIDGTYHWEYETENGITAEEKGGLTNRGSDAEAMRAKGFYRYLGPDNVEYAVQYTADENGFLPTGNHLPTPPPLPEELRRAIEVDRIRNGRS